MILQANTSTQNKDTISIHSAELGKHFPNLNNFIADCLSFSDPKKFGSLSSEAFDLLSQRQIEEFDKDFLAFLNNPKKCTYIGWHQFITEDIEYLRKLPQLKWNRNVKETWVKKINNSIEEKWYLENTIEITPFGEKKDGQHRIELFYRKSQNADKPVRLPIMIKIVNGNLQSLKAMNNARTQWSADDNLASWCHQGIPDYLRMQASVERYSVPVTTLLEVFNPYIGDRKKIFSENLLTYSEQRQQVVHRFLDDIQSVVHWLYGEKQTITWWFIRACAVLFTTEWFDLQRLLSKTTAKHPNQHIRSLKESSWRAGKEQQIYSHLIEWYNFRDTTESGITRVHRDDRHKPWIVDALKKLDTIYS